VTTALVGHALPSCAKRAKVDAVQRTRRGPGRADICAFAAGIGIAFVTACGGSSTVEKSPDAGDGGAGGTTSIGSGGVSAAGGHVAVQTGGVPAAGGTTASGAGGRISADAGLCTPKAGYTAKWVPPIAPRNVCTEAQLTTWNQVCAVQPNADTCDAFRRDPKNASCLSCVLTPSTDGAYGAVIIEPDHYNYSNEAGCIALLDGDASSTGCGAKREAYQLCRAFACADCIADQTQHNACESAAITTVCRSFYEDEVCASASRYASCIAYTTFADSSLAMARRFCAAPSAGADAGAHPVPDAGTVRDAAGD